MLFAKVRCLLVVFNQKTNLILTMQIYYIFLILQNKGGTKTTLYERITKRVQQR